MIRIPLTSRAALLTLAGLLHTTTVAGQTVRDTATTDTSRHHQVLFTWRLASSA
jgi:hypothetical protein